MFALNRIISMTTVILLLNSLAVTQDLREDIWDVRDFPEGTEAFYFESFQGGTRGVTIYTGDFNHDGNEDIVTAPFSSSTMNRTNNGTVFILFGDGKIEGGFDEATYQGTVWKFQGAADDSIAGVELISEDMDGDGIDDIIFGAAHGLEPVDYRGAGEVTILYGSESWGTSNREFDLASIPEDIRHRRFLGEAIGDRLGPWFDAADIDGDGEMDLLTGMDQSDGPDNNRDAAGGIVVIWSPSFIETEEPYLRIGTPEMRPHTTLLHGIDRQDHLGTTVMAQDIDSDGNIDVVASAGVNRSGLQVASLGYIGAAAGDGPNNSRTNSGETYIFWDGEQLKATRELDLANNHDLEMTTIYGETASDFMGEEMMTGDVNGDGQTDLIIGGLTADIIATNDGAAYLFTDTPSLRTLNVLDLASPPADMVTNFYGTATQEWIGDTMEVADIDGDGMDEIFLSLPAGTPFTDNNRFRTGYIPVIWGGQDFAPMPRRHPIGTSTENEFLSAFLVGSENGDLLSYSSAVGDMNGDGIPDYLATAMQGDGIDNAFSNAGELYIFDGALIGRRGSKPRTATIDSGASADEPLVQWQPAEPLLGTITGYEINYSLCGVEQAPITTTNQIVTLNDLSGTPSELTITTIMERNGSVSRSLPLTIETGLVEGPCSGQPDSWILR